MLYYMMVAQAANSPEYVLLQYGAVGLMALLGLIAVRVLFKRLQDQHDREVANLREQLTREETRAGKYEEQLTALNALIREQLAPQLTRATDVIARVAQLLDERQRHDGRRS